MAIQETPSPTHRGNGDGAQQNDVGVGKRDDVVDTQGQSETQERSSLIVECWPKNRRENFKVSLDIYQGRRIIAFRVWFTGNDGVDRPSKTGVSVGIKHLRTIAEAYNKACDEAEARGWIGEVGR
jgi:hypothetical protein